MPIAPPRTRVVNIYEESFDCYVGNPHDKTDPREIEAGRFGFLGNPFTMGSTEERTALFREYLGQRVREDRRFRLALLSLCGKRLGCICEETTDCHAAVLAEWLDEHRDAYRAWFGTTTN